MQTLAVVAPLAFLVGLFVGLLASSAWRIVRRRDYDRWSHRNGSGD